MRVVPSQYTPIRVYPSVTLQPEKKKTLLGSEEGPQDTNFKEEVWKNQKNKI
jgi:hypothetical protein